MQLSRGVMAGVQYLILDLSLAAVHLSGINQTDPPVNPARLYGPAVLVGRKALAGIVYAMGLTCAG